MPNKIMTRYFIVFWWSDGKPGRVFMKTFRGEYVSIPRTEAMLKGATQNPVTVTNILELSESDYPSATT
jgi:hypothetical protein